MDSNDMPQEFIYHQHNPNFFLRNILVSKFSKYIYYEYFQT